MLTTTIHYGLLIALAIALLIAAFTDLRSRTIHNKLNIVIAAGAPVFWWAPACVPAESLMPLPSTKPWIPVTTGGARR